MPPELTFDPVVVGRAETAAWSAYYRREWGRLLAASLTMVGEGFQFSRGQAVRAAWYVLRANQAWAPYPDNDPEAARLHMRRFYALVDRAGRLSVDPDRAAALEVEWWRVHRARQRDATVGVDSLVEALVALYSYIYNAFPEAVRPAARFRADAMDHSDAWVAAGCDPDSVLLAAERRALVASYSALREALDRGALPGARQSRNTVRPAARPDPA